MSLQSDIEITLRIIDSSEDRNCCHFAQENCLNNTISLKMALEEGPPRDTRAATSLRTPPASGSTSASVKDADSPRSTSEVSVRSQKIRDHGQLRSIFVPILIFGACVSLLVMTVIGSLFAREVKEEDEIRLILIRSYPRAANFSLMFMACSFSSISNLTNEHRQSMVCSSQFGSTWPIHLLAFGDFTDTVLLRVVITCCSSGRSQKWRSMQVLSPKFRINLRVLQCYMFPWGLMFLYCKWNHALSCMVLTDLIS